MSDDTINLNKRRAEKNQDCKLWTPLDALEDLVLGIKAGRINPTQLVCHYLTEADDGYFDHGFLAAGVSVQEHISLLELGKWRCLEGWRA